jgi:GNAT superfamily N-acetyltransferase
VPEILVDVAARLDADARFGDRLYDEVIQPAFPPDELDDRHTFLDGVRSRVGVRALALVDAASPVAAIVGYDYPEAHVLLIGYLAVRSGLRSGGRGARLLEAARERWYGEPWCDLVVAEVEDPRYHDDPDLNPGRRLRFYQRNGARLLRRPYFQPRLRPELARVTGMLLIALWVAPGAEGASGVRHGPVVSFLETYFEESEGPADPRDGDRAALLAAYRASPVIELVPLDRYEAVVQIGVGPPSTR